MIGGDDDGWEYDGVGWTSVHFPWFRDLKIG